MANGGLIDPFGGFKEGSKQLSQTVSTIAQIEQGAKRIELEERRLESAERAGTQNIENAKTQLDLSKVKLFLSAKQPEAAADVFNSSKGLNPKGEEITFKGMSGNKFEFSEKAGGVIRTNEDLGEFEVIPASKVKGLEKSLKEKETREKKTEEREAKLEVETFGKKEKKKAEIKEEFEPTVEEEAERAGAIKRAEEEAKAKVAIKFPDPVEGREVNQVVDDLLAERRDAVKNLQTDFGTTNALGQIVITNNLPDRLAYHKQLQDVNNRYRKGFKTAVGDEAPIIQENKVPPSVFRKWLQQALASKANAALIKEQGEEKAAQILKQGFVEKYGEIAGE